MPELKTKWDSMPRVIRGLSLFVLGAAASAAVFEALPDGATPQSRPPSIVQGSGRYAVGVTCVSPSAEILAKKSGGTVTFECKDPVTPEDYVTSLVNLDPEYVEASAAGYNGIFEFDAPGNDIAFNFAGNLGVASVSEVNVGTQHNTSTYGIARPPSGFASNSNSVSSWVKVHN